MRGAAEFFPESTTRRCKGDWLPFVGARVLVRESSILNPHLRQKKCIVKRIFFQPVIAP